MLDERGWVRPLGEAAVRVQSFGYHYHGMTHEITAPPHHRVTPDGTVSVTTNTETGETTHTEVTTPPENAYGDTDTDGDTTDVSDGHHDGDL